MKNLCVKDCIPFLITITIFTALQLGFRQHYCISHTLINITENIRKALDDGNKGCDTIDHQILLANLNHYGICEVSNDWFKSYLSNRSQYVSINYGSGLATISCGVP